MGKVYTKDDLLAAGNETLDKDNQAALEWIIQKESNGKVDAKNPTSTAFGVGQLIKANRDRFSAALECKADTTDKESQVKMMKMYIKTKHGSAVKAKAYWEKNNHY
jgi:trimeric autotransporter adhesin